MFTIKKRHWNGLKQENKTPFIKFSMDSEFFFHFDYALEKLYDKFLTERNQNIYIFIYISIRQFATSTKCWYKFVINNYYRTSSTPLAHVDFSIKFIWRQCGEYFSTFSFFLVFDHHKSFLSWKNRNQRHFHATVQDITRSSRRILLQLFGLFRIWKALESLHTVCLNMSLRVKGQPNGKCSYKDDTSVFKVQSHSRNCSEIFLMAKMLPVWMRWINQLSFGQCGEIL